MKKWGVTRLEAINYTNIIGSVLTTNAHTNMYLNTYAYSWYILIFGKKKWNASKINLRSDEANKQVIEGALYKFVLKWQLLLKWQHDNAYTSIL